MRQVTLGWEWEVTDISGYDDFDMSDQFSSVGWRLVRIYVLYKQIHISAVDRYIYILYIYCWL